MKRCVATILLACVIAGCQRDPRARYGYSLAPPLEGKPWSGPRDPVVPGEVLEAYSIAAPSAPGSLVVFRSGYLPNTTADQLLVQTRYLLLNLPTLELKRETVVDVAGKPGALIECVAAGTGSALSPTGTGKPIPPPGAVQLPTRRVWLRVPRGREEGTLEVFFHCAEADQAALAPAWEKILASIAWRK